jgi:hypothetical protein
MTQDQHGQAPGTGYAVGGEVVPEDETHASPDEQPAPMTRFHKVASALRGDRSEAGGQAAADTPGPNGSWPNRPDEPASVGSRDAGGAEDAGLRPGEATDRLGDFGDIAFGNLLPDAEEYTAQWQQIQFRFVDDPQGSVTDAAAVISQVTAKLEAAIQERQRAIEERQRAIQERASALRGRWGEGSNADTETLRETLRMYRSFMDQLIGREP